MNKFFIPLLLILFCCCSSEPIQDMTPNKPENPTAPTVPENKPNEDTPGKNNPTPDIPNADYGTSTHDANRPIGFATVGTTPTGGKGGNSVIVTTEAELTNALKKTEKLIIYLKGTISTNKVISVLAKDKTVLGLPNSILTNPNRTKDGSGILYFKSGSNNLILRNITFKSAGAYDTDGWDNLCIDGTTNIWVDHCDFQDGVDGNFDCKNASDNIAITWCRFRYLVAPQAGGSGGSNDHRFTSLWGSGASATQDRGHLRTTFQFCWWDEGCRERMPRVRFGQIHIANCLYKSSVTNYCIGLGIEADVYVEKSAFIGVNKVRDDKSKDDKSEGSAKISFNQCQFTNLGKTGYNSNIGTAFIPTYTLATIPAEEVENVVSNYAGATLTITEPR